MPLRKPVGPENANALVAQDGLQPGALHWGNGRSDV